MPFTATRVEVGEKFSEAARLIWRDFIIRDGWSFTFLASVLSVSSGRLSSWLYGDTIPNLDHAINIEDTIGVPARAWLTKPKRKFTPPAKVKV